jgi:hypothetical protein
MEVHSTGHGEDTSEKRGNETPNFNRSNLKEGSNARFKAPEIPWTLES